MEPALILGVVATERRRNLSSNKGFSLVLYRRNCMPCIERTWSQNVPCAFSNKRAPSVFCVYIIYVTQ